MKKIVGKRLFKIILFCLAFVIISPLVLVSKLEESFSESERLFYTFGNLLSLIPGTIGSYFRSGYYYGTLSKSSWNAVVGFGSFFSHRAASMGENVCIGAYCVVGCANIEDNVLLGSRVSILSGKYHHVDKNGNISSSITRLEPVNIGRGSWIGEGAIVMASVSDDCIVSAGSVVGKEVPSGYTAAGNPARTFKRFPTSGEVVE